MAEAVETIIVGAGQAGLSVSCHLTEAGQGHIVLERGAILETWRSQHWDSFALNSPNHLNQLPGDKRPLAHLAEERRLSVATIRLHKAALAAVHKAAGHEDPTDNEGVRRIMQGIARAHGRPQKQAKPLTAEALAAVKATAKSRRALGGPGNRQESAERAAWRARVDVALLATLRDGLLRRSEAAALTWGDVEFRDDGAALVTLRRSKTDQEAEGTVLYVGREAAQALQAIRPAPELLDPGASVFGMTTRHIGNRVRAATKAAGLGEGYHRPFRPRGHGPGPGEERRRTACADDRGPLEIFQDAGQIHGAPSCGPGRRGQVLPRTRRLTPE